MLCKLSKNHFNFMKGVIKKDYPLTLNNCFTTRKARMAEVGIIQQHYFHILHKHHSINL